MSDQIPEWMIHADMEEYEDPGEAEEEDVAQADEEDAQAQRAAAEAKQASWQRMLQRLDMTEGDMERYLKVGEFVCFVCAWAVCVVDFTLNVVACVKR